MKALRDWWRGWSEEDLDSYNAKMAAARASAKPGGVVWITKREMLAHFASLPEIHFVDLDNNDA